VAAIAKCAISEGEKGITALFVRRPVLAFVINTLIAVAGLAAYYGLEIRELPDVDRPVITVNTDFTGASAETIDRELTAVLEGAVSRVSGVKAISSASSFGRSRVTVEFNDGVNLDVAASDMRDAVSRVINQLPDDVDPPRIVKADANADAVMRLAVTSDTKSVEDMTIIVEDEILDTLSAVPGVADVQVYGDRDKIFRVDINQARLASLGLTIADIAKALATLLSTRRPARDHRQPGHRGACDGSVNTPEVSKHHRQGPRQARRRRIGDTGRRSERHLVAPDGKTGIGLRHHLRRTPNTLDISDRRSRGGRSRRCRKA
jgi:HAE1 family hydrophobic/amphiphilic exporter-1